DPRTLRQGRAPLAVHARGLGSFAAPPSRNSRSFVLQIPRVRDAGSRDVDARGLRRAESRLARLRQVGGEARRELARGVPRFPRRDRVGRGAALVERQSRSARHLLYAAGQWMIAAQRPRHLAAILPWQGTYDFYRDRTRQGGILGSGFLGRWWNRSVLRNQHGNPDTPLTDLSTGERNTGPATLAPEELAANRVEY